MYSRYIYKYIRNGFRDVATGGGVGGATPPNGDVSKKSGKIVTIR